MNHRDQPRRIAGGTAVSVCAALLLACGGRSSLVWGETSGLGGSDSAGGASTGGIASGAGGIIPGGGGVVLGGGGIVLGGGGVVFGTGGAVFGGGGVVLGGGGLPAGGSGGTASGGTASNSCPPGSWKSEPDACLPWSSCPPGTAVSQPGTELQDRLCEPCAAGMFSDAENLPTCQPWSGCSIAEVEVMPGTDQADTTCSPTSPWGFVGDSTRNVVRALAITDTHLYAAGIELTPQAVQRAVLHEFSLDGMERRAWVSPTSTHTQGTGVAVAGGQVLMSGSTRGALHGPVLGEDDAYLQLLDAEGAPVWGNQFGTGVYELDVRVAAGPSGSSYVTGSTEGALDAPVVVGASDIFLRRYDAGGTLEWAHQFSRGDADRPSALVSDGNGTVYIAGSASDALGFVVAFSPAGDVLWELAFGDLGWVGCRGLFLAPDGDLYVAGTQALAGAEGTGVALARVTPSGTVVWSSSASTPPGSEHEAGALVVTPTSAHVFGTATTWYDGAPRGDALAASFTTSGSYLGTEIWGATAHETIDAAVVSAAGDIFIGGTVTWPQRGLARGFVLPWTPPSP